MEVSAATSRSVSNQPATAEKLRVIAQLATIDRKVRAHEQAHLAAAGAYATTGASYTFQVGPDGQRYAVGGEVGIDVSPDPSDPQRTIDKARTIEAAAYAPADPSPQDREVAAAAAQMAAQAEREIASRGSGETGSYGLREAAQVGQLINLVA